MSDGMKVWGSSPESEFFNKAQAQPIAEEIRKPTPAIDPIWPKIRAIVAGFLWVAGISVVAVFGLVILGAVLDKFIGTHGFQQDVVWTHILERIGIGDTLALGCFIMLILIFRKLSAIAKYLAAGQK